MMAELGRKTPKADKLRRIPDEGKQPDELAEKRAQKATPEEWAESLSRLPKRVIRKG